MKLETIIKHRRNIKPQFFTPDLIPDQEIKDILERLEKENMDLEASTNDYKRLHHLNDHVDNLFKKKLEKIRSIGTKN